MPIEADLAITNITVINPTQDPLVQMTVLIKDNRIVRIGRHINIGDNTVTVNGQDKYLIPGLWDFHVHLTFDSLVTPSMYDLFIANGITSIRDTGGLIEKMLPLIEQAEGDPQRYPRVMWAGPLLDGKTVVYDGSGPFNPEIGVGINSPGLAREMVEKLEAAGVDLLKAYEMLEPEIYEAILTIAQEKGLPVTGHVPLSMDVVSASNAGLSSMEHFRNIEMSAATNATQLLEERRKLLAKGLDTPGSALRQSIHQTQRIEAVRNIDSTKLERIAEVLATNNTVQIPTLGIAGARMHALWNEEEWLETFNSLSESTKAIWLANANSLSNSEASTENLEYARFCYSLVKYLADRNVKILAGTDTPIFLLTPGFSLHKELQFLVNAGLSERDALAAATIRPAEYFDMQHELGLIKEGYLADMVILGANPLEDISNTQDVRGVIKDGRYFDRSKLDALLGNRIQKID